MPTPHFLAFDLGAESGRAILGRLEGSTLVTRELSRFPNGPTSVLGHLHWNALGLFEDIKKGLKACVVEAGVRPESVAVDTWGVDFGFLAEDGALLGYPLAYRDDRTKGAMEGFFERVPRKVVYELTGIQFLPFNSLFQLFSMVRDRSPFLRSAHDLLFMPDLFTYLLTGVKGSEFTIASTSQLLNMRRRAWSAELMDALGLPLSLLQSIRAPGTIIGPLLPAIAQEVALPETQVVATSSHDTAAAIAAIPAAEENWAYISSGTWSLMGIETVEPIITAEALAANFTNEGGVSETVRFLKNIAGLWLLQQSRKEWSKERDLTYAELVRSAAGAAPFQALVDPDWPEFLNPPSMVEAIAKFCRLTGQPPPPSPPHVVRCVLESLALKYRFTLEEIRRLAGQKIVAIHVIGGGSKNELLCQFTADATGIKVVAGPAEATALGNILVQALGLGYVRSLSDIRSIVRESVELKTYEPGQTAPWDRAFNRFRELVQTAGANVEAKKNE